MSAPEIIRRAARWFGIGVASAPVLDLADQHGLLQGLVTLDVYYLLVAPSVLWLQLGFFVGVGIGAAAVMRRHSPGGRMILFWGCSVPLLAYAISGGLRLSVVAMAIILCFTYVQLRLVANGTRE